MAHDLPRDDEGLILAAQNFHAAVTAHATNYGLTAAHLTELNNFITRATGDRATFIAAREALNVASAEKKQSMRLLEQYFRQLRQLVQANPATTDVDRETLHLATGDAGDSTAANAAEFQQAPLLNVVQAGVHAHRVNFFMVGKESGSTKKPANAEGCKIFLKIDGAPSTDLDDYQLIAFDTRSPYEYTHDAENAGKQAHYIAAWSARDDSQSPQSEVFSLTIT